MNEPALDEQYWNSRYKLDETAWDMGRVSPSIAEYVNQLSDKNISILIPGCGNAYEAEYLLQQGFTNVTVIDISPVLTEALHKRMAQYSGRELYIICGDFFEMDQQFDLVIEQTFFCALNPSLRTKYAKHMLHILRENGKIVGLLFNREFDDGPPFGGNEEEYKKLFAKDFKIHTMETAYNSIAPRAGVELWINLEKK